MAASVTVSVLVAPGTGVLCPIALVVKVGTATVSGSAPLATPYKAVPALAIATLAIEPTALLPSVMVAATLTAGDACDEPPLVRLNDTTHGSPAASPAAAAVSTSVPSPCVHAPVVPSLPPHVVTLRAVLSGVCAPVSPEIVTVEPMEPCASP